MKLLLKTFKIASINEKCWLNVKSVVSKRFNGYLRPVNMAFDLYVPPTEKKSNAALIVMHGLLGSKQNWRSICRTITPLLGMKVYAVDARNHGDSPHTEEHNSELMAEDVVEFSRVHNIQHLNVLGHSMGGRTMMALALKYPDLVKSSVIVDISPISIPRDVAGMNEIFNAMRHTSLIKNKTLAEGRSIMRKKLLENLGADYEGTVNFIMLNLRKRESGEFYWAANIDTLQKMLGHFRSYGDTIQKFAPYQKPTLFICGTKSDYFNKDEWPEVKSIFPNAEIEWLDTYHLVHLEDPVGFTNVVVNFLRKIVN